MELYIDIETYSPIDLTVAGVYRYCEDFVITLISYAIDNEDVNCIDLVQHPTHSDINTIKKMLLDDNVVKVAHNAAFEQECFRSHFGYEAEDSKNWVCTMQLAYIAGYPASLDGIAKALDTVHKKDPKGTRLLNMFAKPNNGHRIMPQSKPTQWEEFKRYCNSDVATLRDVYKKIPYRFDDRQKLLQEIDRKINTKGFYVDVKRAEKIEARLEKANEFFTDQIITLSGVQNPKSSKQMQEFLGLESVAKPVLKQYMDSNPDPESVNTEVISLKLESSKSSNAKYKYFRTATCKDGRIKGTLQIYGAGQTGRWAGRLIQPHNFPRPSHDGKYLQYRDVIDTIPLRQMPQMASQLLRTMIIAPPGKALVIADFSSIEARVLAWIANEQWKLDVFNGHGKIYEEVASRMFSIPIEQVTKGSIYREQGKIAELALGYQGASGALANMGRAYGIMFSEQESLSIVSRWRNANQNIVRFWANVEKAVYMALRGTNVEYKNISFRKIGSDIVITLPSGYPLIFREMTLTQDKLSFLKSSTITKTYGGKLTENITQSLAKECLVEVLIKLRHLDIVLHVHDEVVVECGVDEAPDILKEVERVMGEEVSFGKGLPLKGVGFISDYYKKD